MNTMNYKGYTARVEFSDEDDCFVGRIIGITDVVGFHASDVVALRAALREAVDDYLATCEKVGKAPQRTYSGKVMLRIPPEVHARAATRAEAAGKSLNQWAAEVLSQA